AIGEQIVDFHGQHEHQRLFSTRYQLLTLDEFAGLSNARGEVNRLYDQHKELDRRIEAAELKTRRMVEERELLEFYVDELAQLELQEGEFQALQDEKRRLSNAEKLAELCTSIDDQLWSEPRSVCGSLSSLERQLIHGSKMDDSISRMADRVADARISLEEVASEARALGESLLFDTERQEMVEDRLAALASLGRKHRCEADELLGKLQEFRQQLAEFEQEGDQLNRIRVDREAVLKELRARAKGLSTARRASAEHLARVVCGNLKSLAMQGEFGMEFAERESQSTDADVPGRDGFETVEYVISTNPGQPMMPLRKIASGGEVSRVMLALKTALAGADDVPIMVFDELDSGIGGTTGNYVGKMLKRLSKSRQILVISHLVQIAQFALNHISITKEASEVGVSIAVAQLEGDARVEELARMLGSEGRRHAHELAAGLLADSTED
ncbi:MAG: hypothetical protein JW941_06875, partial [Candidatus Coatesbacteria bacterium]|nr:hypothetical protein [Candidatus Coatesbacteria bacterium]